MLFLFLSVSFINLAEARGVSSQDKLIYVADFECTADKTSEFDSDDGRVSSSYDISLKFAVVPKQPVVQTNTAYYFSYVYLRPLSRAPPKTFI